jgi:phosphohistidine phosphatase
MDLYFLRHGVAVSRDEWEGPDSERPLTEEGKEGVARVAAFLAKRGAALDVIISSPYVRAKETADMVGRRLDLVEKVVCDDRLTPGFDRIKLIRLLKNYPQAGGVMLVGHEPDFTSVLEQVVGARAVLKKGGMAYVQTADASLRKATLGWLVQPALLEA